MAIPIGGAVLGSAKRSVKKFAFGVGRGPFQRDALGGAGTEVPPALTGIVRR